MKTITVSQLLDQIMMLHVASGAGPDTPVYFRDDKDRMQTIGNVKVCNKIRRKVILS